MDIGYTYGSPSMDRLDLYVPPNYEPPEVVVITREGREVSFVRLSDRDLECGEVRGVSGRCASHECHREVLGECRCGRHRGVHSVDPEDHRPTIRLRKAII